MSFEETLRKLQNAFCASSHVYSKIVDKDGLSLVSAEDILYEAQEYYIDSLIDKDIISETLESFGDGDAENILDINISEKYHAGAVALRDYNGFLKGAWFVLVNAAEEPVSDDNPLIWRLGKSDFDVKLALLESISNTLLKERAEKESLVEKIEEIEHTRNALAKQLRQSEVLTEIIKQMDSQEEFPIVAGEIIKLAGEYLEISHAFLVSVGNVNGNINSIASWDKESLDDFLKKLCSINESDIPFLDGRTYTVSSDSLMPDSFGRFFKENDITAGVFLPVEIESKLVMYLGFVVSNAPKKWAIDQISFLNDVKRIIQNILHKRRVQSSLEDSYAVVESTLNNAGCGLCVVDTNKKDICYNNIAFEEIFDNIKDRNDFDKLIANMGACPQNIHEYHLEKKDSYVDIGFKEIIWLLDTPAVLCTIFDVTESKRYVENIEKTANIDETTSLPNRHQFNKDFAPILTRAIEKDISGNILYLNLDDFKDINDALGHKMGDTLLKSVAAALEKIAKDCRCYRIGGDEFIILVPDASRVKVDRLIATIKKRFEIPWQISNTDYYCTMCMGIVKFPQDGKTADVLIQRADIALRTAKKHGRNVFEYFTKEEEVGAIKRLDLEKELRETVLNGCKEFEVYYQPIIDFSKEERPCCGAEALARWNSSKFGMIMPGEFIPMAEYLGLILPIGEYILREACTRCKYWNDFGHPEYHINVNVSVVQLMQSDIVGIIKEILGKTGLNPGHLTLEITESIAGYDIEQMKAVLKNIRGLGVRLALDDFGTGYSSLSRLKEMPMDVIKIDKCFVDDIGQDIFSDAFIRTVSDLAGSIDVDIVVEGVEHGSQLGELKKVKADMIQGYYYDKPLSRETFESKYVDKG